MLGPDRNNDQTPRGIVPRAADGGLVWQQAALAPHVVGSALATCAPSNFLASIVGNVPQIERSARLRALQALVGVMVRPKPSALLQTLRAGEGDDAELDRADKMLAALPSLSMRHLLAAWTLHLTNPTTGKD